MLTEREIEIISDRARRRIANNHETEWSYIVLELIELVKLYQTGEYLHRCDEACRSER